MNEILSSQRNCLKDKCLSDASKAAWSTYNFAELQDCVKNCEAGTNEILTMQNKHSEVARLTYTKNIARCEQIHGTVRRDLTFINDSEDIDNDLIDKVNATGLAHCISHNTDKIDRRFFGYYATQRGDLVQKYTYP